MLMGVTRANHKMRFKLWRTGVMAQLIVLGHLVLEGGHAEALEAVLQALGHFAQGRNDTHTYTVMTASFRQVYIHRYTHIHTHTYIHTYIHTMLASFRQHPLHFGIKAECCQWALAMITGRSAPWKLACKDAMRLANLTVYVCM